MAVEVTVDPSFVRVELTGLDALFAFKRRLEIPTRLVSEVRALRRSEVPHREGTWLRAPGPHLPGLIRHGLHDRDPGVNSGRCTGNPRCWSSMCATGSARDWF